MSEYSTVDFSVLLLMGTYMLSSFCLWQRGKRSVKVHLGVCAQHVSPLGTVTQGRHLHQVTVPAAVPECSWHLASLAHLALLSELVLFILAHLVRESWYLLVGFLSFFPSEEAEEYQEKTPRREGGKSFGGQREVGAFTWEVPFACQLTPRSAWAPIKTPIWGTVAVGGTPVLIGVLLDSLQPTREFKKILLLG